MDNRILGLHHITAIADNAKRNLDFYTQVLGVRLVKKTVNFDDPGTYHFYFGNETGTPGTILTFFPWEGIGQGTNGSGMATHIGYAVPKGSLAFWKNRLESVQIKVEEAEIFGEKLISFRDPDGLQLQLIEPSGDDSRKVWTTDDIKDGQALKGFHNVTLTLRDADPTMKVLTDTLGYDLQKQEGERYRLATDAIDTANLIDIIENDKIPAGRNAAGTNHHIAFRVKDDNILMEYREKVLSAGLSITPKINRDYFYSLYFREPGGVLFEIATDNPGFTVDEPLEELGSHLKLPAQYEGMRNKIEGVLPNLS
ncbi:ring-cleaving dioxygenase [Chryseobacterium indologenes]|uniref:ring-cleaving dioxygenase n=1 Tax=Chryseobacterium indologenes TaxID=253 RepID=UPI000F4FD4A8|nr:ring-cleaving dioxygenase [Chryseobacterium indologenes]AYZ34963.1 ring-cleaving dioxygenase [Chryseobacterium indologenes]MBF6643706.1 ring-cleaving dioxygenase [Chryseobacterium indologenes]MBU3046700.1 ring-cleaving dioxygenase [Chryseobacterium indologenes]MEB4761614.1 ring-cleaving dioxygenase [Chryseobacterium indologenes]QQQ72560.1 ring-cleaving dioxygenase [Chryseobacterium indologenes]